MKRWEAWVNHVGWSLTALSGLAYGAFKYFTANPDPDSRLSHPWQPAVLAAHVLVAPAAVFALGIVLRHHALGRLASGERDRRRTGIVMTLFAIPLILTGYVVQVLTGDAARRWTGWIHAALGVIYAIGYLMHPMASGSLPDDPVEAAAEKES